MEQTTERVHCPMCGMEFARVDTACAHGCPLGGACTHVRCPHCDYEFPDRSPTVSWFGRWLRRLKKQPRPANGSTLTLDRLTAGERGEVVKVKSPDPRRRNTLTVFGLVPGTEVHLIQRRPTYVIRIGETELGLDQEIAAEIQVKLL